MGDRSAHCEPPKNCRPARRGRFARLAMPYRVSYDISIGCTEPSEPSSARYNRADIVIVYTEGTSIRPLSHHHGHHRPPSISKDMVLSSRGQRPPPRSDMVLLSCAPVRISPMLMLSVGCQGTPRSWRRQRWRTSSSSNTSALRRSACPLHSACPQACPHRIADRDLLPSSGRLRVPEWFTERPHRRPAGGALSVAPAVARACR